jgi:hypothetical protein
MNDFAPTSPTLETPNTVIHTQKQFSDSLTQELTDEEIKQALALLVPLKTKWSQRFISKLTHDASFRLDDALEMLSEMSDEFTYRLATELNVLATVDTTPLLEGKGPQIEWIGVMPGHDLNKHGFDHEKKAWEARKAKERGEDFLGQKEETNTGKAKKRNKNG